MLNLDPLQLRRTSKKVSMLYKIAGGLNDAKARVGTLSSTQNPTHGHESKFLIPYSRTETHRSSFFPSAIHLWKSIPPHAPAADPPRQGFKSITEAWLKCAQTN